METRHRRSSGPMWGIRRRSVWSTAGSRKPMCSIFTTTSGGLKRICFRSIWRQLRSSSGPEQISWDIMCIWSSLIRSHPMGRQTAGIISREPENMKLWWNAFLRMKNCGLYFSMIICLQMHISFTACSARW